MTYGFKSTNKVNHKGSKSNLLNPKYIIIPFKWVND